MQIDNLFLLGLCLCACGCATPVLPSTPDDVKTQVIATERAFAKTMADRDHNAFADFIAADAIFFSGPKPLHGKQQVVDYWARFYTTPAAPFSWEPREVEVLASGDLALSSGPVRDATGKDIAAVGHPPFIPCRTDIDTNTLRYLEVFMDSHIQMLLSQQDLAKRWGRSEAAIGLASAVGAGPRYVKIDGAIKYPVEDILRYERACLFFDPAELAFQSAV